MGSVHGLPCPHATWALLQGHAPRPTALVPSAAGKGCGRCAASFSPVQNNTAASRGALLSRPVSGRATPAMVRANGQTHGGRKWPDTRNTIGRSTTLDPMKQAGTRPPIPTPSPHHPHTTPPKTPPSPHYTTQDPQIFGDGVDRYTTLGAQLAEKGRLGGGIRWQTEVLRERASCSPSLYKQASTHAMATCTDLPGSACIEVKASEGAMSVKGALLNSALTRLKSSTSLNLESMFPAVRSPRPPLTTSTSPAWRLARTSSRTDSRRRSTCAMSARLGGGMTGPPPPRAAPMLATTTHRTDPPPASPKPSRSPRPPSREPLPPASGGAARPPPRAPEMACGSYRRGGGDARGGGLRCIVGSVREGRTRAGRRTLYMGRRQNGSTNLVFRPSPPDKPAPPQFHGV